MKNPCVPQGLVDYSGTETGGREAERSVVLCHWAEKHVGRKKYLGAAQISTGSYSLEKVRRSSTDAKWEEATIYYTRFE